MAYKFKACGHKNITAKHKTTFEFTKDKSLTLRGDCIIGVSADFSLLSLKEFIKSLKNRKIKIIIEINNINQGLDGEKIIKEIINAEVNPGFNSDSEMVIRKSDFIDKRTFAVKANKSSIELGRNLISLLKDPKQEINILIDKPKI